MAIGIRFRKDRADYLLDCLANGKPIEGVRNVNDFLEMAGACVIAARSRCPKITDVDRDSGSAELLEAMEEQFPMDLHAAFETFCHLFMLHQGELYDTVYEPEVEGWAELDDEDEPVFEPTKGKRK